MASKEDEAKYGKRRRKPQRIKPRGSADVVLSWLLSDATVLGAAEVFGVHTSTVRRWMKYGVPPSREAQVTSTYGKVSAEEAIRTAMADSRMCIQDTLGGHPLDVVHINQDGSIDAQLTVYEIPRGMPARQALIELDICCRALTNTFNTFVQVGLRWTGKGGVATGSGDRRYRGLEEGSTYYYAVDMRRGGAFLHAVDMADNVARKHRRKIETVFARLHWNPDGVAPKEWNPRKAVYRAFKRKEKKNGT